MFSTIQDTIKAPIKTKKANKSKTFYLCSKLVVAVFTKSKCYVKNR